MPNLTERFRNGWNAFLNRDPTTSYRYHYSNAARPDRVQLSRASIRSTVNTIFNRIAVDVSSLDVRHVRLNENGQYKETIPSDLNNALSLDANLDQTGRALIQDAVMSMFDEGCVAIFPVDVDVNPYDTDGYKIYSLRTAKIVEWYPSEVLIEAYDERDGKKKQIRVPKRTTVIVENPFYSIMNEPNSTGQRLRTVLSQLDRFNSEINPGKMDLIIQFPFQVKSKARQILAENRRKNLEEQMTGSQYGIGYIDGTEKVIQLNRSLENNLWAQAKDLTFELYNQFGLTQTIFDGTADEQTMLNYYDRTVNPIINAFSEEMERKWLSKTARTQGQAIRYFRNPFKLVPVSTLSELADKFTRNEIMTSNEIRSVIGLKASNDPKADQLINSNLNHADKNQNQRNSQIEEVDITEKTEKKKISEV